MARFAVITCSGCRRPWTVETRHRTVRCPVCGEGHDAARRTRIWEGDDAGQARAALQVHLGGPPADEPVPRHDDALHAAAAEGRRERNLSRRADVVVHTLCRLQGQVGHDDLLEAMARTGIPDERAEREVVRMLAADRIYEPRAGSYELL